MSDLLTRARTVLDSTVFPPGFGGPQPLAGGFPALIDWVRARRAEAGAPLTLTPSLAHYPDLDPFWAVTVRAGDDYLATIADRWPGADDRDFALGVLRRAAA